MQKSVKKKKIMKENKGKDCISCLWNWNGLHGEGYRVCYNRESIHYEKKAFGMCKDYESKPDFSNDVVKKRRRNAT